MKILLLPGRKVSTFVELVVIDEFVIRARCPTPGLHGLIELVIRIDHQQCSDLFVKLQLCHVLSYYAFTKIESQIC